MFKLFIVFGLFLSPALYAQFPSEFPGQTMQEAQEWTEKMWPSKKLENKTFTLDDFYLMYTYSSQEQMAQDFAEQLCLDNYNYYAEIGFHAFDQDGIGRSFGRNSLLEALFQDHIFLTHLNRCLEDHNKSIEPIVIKALVASQVTRGLALLGLGVGISATVKLFTATSKVFIKKASQEIAKTRKQKLMHSFKQTGWFALKTTPVIAGYSGLYMFDSLFKNQNFRNDLMSDVYPPEGSKRAICFKKARAFENKKSEIERIYQTKKEELTAAYDKQELSDEDYKLMHELLEEEYNIMQTYLLEEEIRNGKYYDSCSTLAPVQQ
ncbi:MAG: hypothetical protein MK008_13710 [Bdellovibrionales bacterium]|nr:hypothetical protein [Bdellovibrionales bacterium]